jgi:hypothetical protein
MRSVPKGPAVFVACLLVVFLAGLSARPGQVDGASPDPSQVTRLLETFVDQEGWVDYAGLQEKGGGLMEEILEALEEPETGPSDAKRNMALWINAYNLFTLKLVADHYPVDSIRKIPGVSGVAGTGQWKEKLWILNGQRISLDEIENDRLRPMGDPRIHFALVCASRGCPPLARKAYTAGNLEPLLDEQARRFNQSPRGLATGWNKTLFGEKPVLKLSSIYDWFKKDFLLVSPDLPGYVLPYATDRDRAFVEQHKEDLSIRYMDYSWALNDRSSAQAD